MGGREWGRPLMAGRFGIGTLKSSATRTPIEKDLNLPGLLAVHNHSTEERSKKAIHDTRRTLTPRLPLPPHRFMHLLLSVRRPLQEHSSSQQNSSVRPRSI